MENCVTCCVMESMCGRFQLSDPRKAPYLWPKSYDAPAAATVPCVGSEGMCAGIRREAPPVNKALCVLTANYTLRNNVKIKIDHVNHCFLA